MPPILTKRITTVHIKPHYIYRFVYIHYCYFIVKGMIWREIETEIKVWVRVKVIVFNDTLRNNSDISWLRKPEYQKKSQTCGQSVTNWLQPCNHEGSSNKGVPRVTAVIQHLQIYWDYSVEESEEYWRYCCCCYCQ